MSRASAELWATIHKAGAAVALAFFGAGLSAAAETRVTWNWLLDTRGEDVAWRSPTPVDTRGAEYDAAYEITRLEIWVRWSFFDFGPFDVTDDIPPENRSGSGTTDGPPPVTIFDGRVEYPPPPDPPAFAADVNIHLDADGYGNASLRNVVLGQLRFYLEGFGEQIVTLKRVRIQGTVTVTSVAAGDADRNGRVDQSDLAVVLSAYGTCAGDEGYVTAADFDASGCIDQADLALLLSNYGYGG
jgi:hypothetical protein